MQMDSVSSDNALATPAAALSDAEIVRRVQDGQVTLFEILMRRHNQQLYRAARAVIGNERDVEDVMQQAYINAFTHLHQFESRSLFSTWLTRIALNEAFALRKQAQQTVSLQRLPQDSDRRLGGSMESATSLQPDPERHAYAEELRRVLEAAVEALPESYRTVFMLRDIEGLSTAETGEGLGLGDEAVKTRLHRARAMIRRAVTARIGSATAGAFQFPAPRCDRVVAAVFARIDRG